MTRKAVANVKVILIDSGTTNSRLRLYDRTTNKVMDSEKIRVGVRDTAISGNNTNLKSQLKKGIEILLTRNQLTPSEIKCIAASGMITSNLGICEIPHVASPAGISDFAKSSKLSRLEEFLYIPCVFIPGMKNAVNLSGNEDLVSCINDFDVMRGEEVESFGLLKQFAVQGKGMIVLPGSHTKFVAVGENKHLLYCLSTLEGKSSRLSRRKRFFLIHWIRALLEALIRRCLNLGMKQRNSIV